MSSTQIVACFNLLFFEILLQAYLARYRSFIGRYRLDRSELVRPFRAESNDSTLCILPAFYSRHTPRILPTIIKSYQLVPTKQSRCSDKQLIDNLYHAISLLCTQSKCHHMSRVRYVTNSSVWSTPHPCFMLAPLTCHVSNWLYLPRCLLDTQVVSILPWLFFIKCLWV